MTENRLTSMVKGALCCAVFAGVGLIDLSSPGYYVSLISLCILVNLD